MYVLKYIVEMIVIKEIRKNGKEAMTVLGFNIKCFMN